ncbi:MAG: AEC family transporter [Planctomycetes bacterium]|nr:AEC family transporter [Planctomycetota bacterium]MCC8115612.1 AEC family transporter [Planctomycetota bacterium]
MVSGIVVFYKIATTCLLILVGYIVRRMKLLPENSVSVVSAYLLYVGLPTYMMYYTPASITLETLGTYWYYPVIGAALLFVCDMFGWLTSRLWAGPGEGPTFRLLVALPNWVFMAMAVVEPIFREEGVRVVLLYKSSSSTIWVLPYMSGRPGWPPSVAGRRFSACSGTSS